MAEIVPSLLSADFLRIGEQLAVLNHEKTPYLHVDVMDGAFVPSLSFGFPVISTIRKGFDGLFDVHLMIQEPARYIERFAEAGADMITVHVEACSDVRETLRLIHRCGKKAGISLKPGTPLESIMPYLDEVELVLVMTVEPGFGGQKYMHEMTEKIRSLKASLTQSHPKILIEVDGGIHGDTIKEAFLAGSDLLVSGSGVFKGDIAENLRKFREILAKAEAEEKEQL